MSARSARWRWSRARHTAHRTGSGAAVAPRSVTFCDWVGRLRAVAHGRQWVNSMTASRRGKTGPAGRNGGCPGDGGCAAYGGCGVRARGRAGRPSLPLLFPCLVRAAGDECGGAEPRPARCVLLGACLPQPGRPVPLAALAWCLFTVQLSTRSPAGGPGPAFAIWSVTPPVPPYPPLRSAPRGGTSPTHRRSPGHEGPARSYRPGGRPPVPPAALRAPRWYFADTPALAGPRGPGSLAGYDRLALTRCGARRYPPTRR